MESNTYMNECQSCKSKFNTEIHNRYYCSESCKDNLRRNFCIRCDEDFYWKGNRGYCSDRCRSTICINCKQVFIGKSSHREKFCCRDCKTEYLTKYCKYCSNPYISSSDTEFCSSECKKEYNHAMRFKAICKNCKSIISFGKDLKVPAFCSSECESEFADKNTIGRNQRKKPNENDLEVIVKHRVKILMKRHSEFIITDSVGLNYNSIGGFSNQIKDKVLKRDHYKCYVCESDSDIEVHHILKQSLGGNHDMNNLVTLCRSCHRSIETQDEDYAVKKCIKNARKNFGLKNDKVYNHLSNVEFLNIIELEAQTLFRLIYNKEDESELYLSICKVLDLVEERKNR